MTTEETTAQEATSNIEEIRVGDPDPEITQEVLDEGLTPDLSKDFFMWGGKKIQIQILKWSNQRKFALTLHPVAESLAFDIANADIYTSLAGLIKYIDIVPKLIQIIAADAGKPITDEEMDEARVPFEDMCLILVQMSMKNQKIGQPISDFFTRAWPLVQRKIAREAMASLENLEQEERLIEAQKAKKNSMTSTVIEPSSTQ